METTEEIKEGNELIADVMGVTLYDNPRYGSYYIGAAVPEPFANNLNYYSSWEWLHTVIDMINYKGKGYNFVIFKTYVSLSVEKENKFYRDFHFAHSEYITSEQSGKEAAFRLIVKYLKWEKENKL